MAEEASKRRLREVARDRDRYGVLLVLVLVDYVALILVDSGRWAGLVHAVPVSLTVLLALHTSGAWPRTVRFAQIVVFLAVVAGITQVFTDARQNGAVGSWLAAVLLVIASMAVLRRILRHSSVTLETLYGAVSVYIMIGLIFSYLYVGIGHVTTSQFFAQTKSPVSSDYVYFSYITLTTVGFGDFTPVTNVARSVVVLEALIGQIFLVTLVARLVSLYSASDAPGQRAGRGRRVVDPIEAQARRRGTLGGWVTARRPSPSEGSVEPGEDRFVDPAVETPAEEP
jgi:hypothetical protein